MEKILILLLIFSLKISAQKFNFGPIFSAFNERTIGLESTDDFMITHSTQQSKLRGKYGFFLDYQIINRISVTTNLQFSKPLNGIGVDINKFGNSEGGTKLISYSENRINSEIHVNFNVIQNNKLKVKLLGGLDLNNRLSFVNNTVTLGKSTADLEYEELLNLVGTSLKRRFLRNVVGIKGEYNKIIFQTNYSYFLPKKSIANGFNFQNSYVHNYVTNNSLSFSVAYKLR